MSVRLEVSTRAELGERVSELRRRSGLSLRELADRIGSSPSTVSGWCRAKNLPFPAQTSVFAAMLTELGVEDPTPWLEVVGRLRGEGEPEGRAPYRGLEAFGWEDRSLFFGRARVVDRVLERLAQVEGAARCPRLVLVVGASGVGKSSVLRAGVWPRLVEAGRRTVLATPADIASDGLAAQIPDAEHERPTGSPRVVLMDALEDVLTGLTGQERDRVLEEIAALTDRDDGGASVVATLRADALGELAASPALGAALECGQVVVPPMGASELSQAIVEPARAVGASVDEELVELLVGTFGPSGRAGGEAQVGSLPLLSHALAEAWARSSGARITVADYLATGGVDGAVERSAEAVLATLDAREREVARQVLLRLVHVDEPRLVTRRAVTYEELDGLARGGEEALSAVLERFVDARLLTAGSQRVQIAHDAVLTAWPRLAGWIDQALEELRVQRRAAEAARVWVDSGRDASALARGALLAELRAWADDAKGGGLALNDRERAFLDASIAHADAEVVRERQRRRGLRRLAVASVVAAAAAIVLAWVAIDARSTALTARDEALSRQAAITAERLTDADPLLAAHIAVAAHAVAPTEQARSAVLNAAAGPSGQRWLGGPGSSALAVGAAEGVVAVSDSSQASVRLLTAAPDGGLEPAGALSLDAPDVAIFALALAPDAQTLAVGDAAGEVTLWDVDDPSDPAPLAGPLDGLDDAVQELAYADDGDTLTLAGAGPGVLRFDVSDPAEPSARPEVAWDPVVWSVATSPAGLLAFGAEEGVVQLWAEGEADGAPLAELEVGDDDVLDVALAAEADVPLLAAATRGGELAAWKVAESGDPTPVDLEDPGFTTWANAVAVTDDGSRLAAGSSNGTVRVHATETGAPIATLDHPAAVTGLAFADDATLLSTAVDGTLRRWQLDDVASSALEAGAWNLQFDERGHLFGFSTDDTGRWEVSDGAMSGGPILEASQEGVERFSGTGAVTGDGEVVAQGRRGGDVLLYDAADPRAPQRLDAHLTGADERIERLAFHPDGDWVATIRDHAHLWRLDDGLPPAGQPSPHEPSIELDDAAEGLFNLDWSRTGELLALASADGHVYVYGVDDDRDDPVDAIQLRARLDVLGSDAYAVAFHPDQPLLAAAGTDGRVQFWDVGDPADPHAVGGALVGPPGRVFDLAFDASGGWLAAAAVDGTAWVWTVEGDGTAERYAMLDTGGAAAYSVAFAPDRPALVAGDADGLVHLWRLDAEQATARLCANPGEPITAEEWERHLPDRAYDQPCDPPP